MSDQALHNCYVATVASCLDEARDLCAAWAHVDVADLKHVHTEAAEEAEESDTYVFSMWADSLEVEDMLHDHYELKSLRNMPIEIF